MMAFLKMNNGNYIQMDFLGYAKNMIINMEIIVLKQKNFIILMIKKKENIKYIMIIIKIN
jgi:hypothetical protein